MHKCRSGYLHQFLDQEFPFIPSSVFPPLSNSKRLESVPGSILGTMRGDSVTSPIMEAASGAGRHQWGFVRSVMGISRISDMIRIPKKSLCARIKESQASSIMVSEKSSESSLFQRGVILPNQCSLMLKLTNIERDDKSGAVGQIPELRRSSLETALCHLSVREEHYWEALDSNGVRSNHWQHLDWPDQLKQTKDLIHEK